MIKNDSTENSSYKYSAPNTSDFIDLTRSPLQSYNDSAVQQFGYLDNQGLALDDDDSGNGLVYIDQLYILPQVSSDRISPEEQAKSEFQNSNKKNEARIESFNIGGALWKYPRVTLLGDPGVGKSTLVQWLVCSLCHNQNNLAKEQLGNIFPLVLTARKLEKNAYRETFTEEQFIEVIAKSQGSSLSDKLLSEMAFTTLLKVFTNGQLLLLVDGLDEISPELVNWLSHNIKKLLTKYPKIRLVLTARVVGFDNTSFWEESFDSKNQEAEIAQENASNFEVESSSSSNEDIKPEIQNFGDISRVFYLAPFSPAQRSMFANNWVENYIPPNSEQRQQFFKGIDEVSRHSIQLNALSRIPVLLNLICFVLYRRGKLPNGRAELYQRIVETYLVTMDKVRSINLELSEEYDYHDIKYWLGKLALRMQAGEVNITLESPLSNLTEAQLDELRESLPELKSERTLQITEIQLKRFLSIQLTEAVDCASVETHGRQLINYIKSRTGFLIPRGQKNNDELYGFSHLSFQEYFAAYAISKTIIREDSSTPQSLLYTISVPSWSEVWQLVFEELSLNGSSRKEIEKTLERLFPIQNILFRSEEQLMRKYPRSAVPTEAILYGKLINNTAIKISNEKRKQRKKELGKLYLANGFNLEKTLNDNLNQCISMDENFLTSLGNLTYLNLSKKGFKKFDWIEVYSQLRALNLHDCEIDDCSIVKSLKNVTVLFLGSNHITDISPLKALVKLEQLYLHGNNINDLATLSSLTNLRALTLEGEDIVDISPLKNLRKLSRLSLSAPKLMDFSAISQLTELKSLELAGCVIDDLQLLSNLPLLENLDLSSSDLSDLSQLHQLDKLESLKLSDSHNLDCESLYGFQNLTSLTLPAELGVVHKDRLKATYPDITLYY